MNRTVHAAPLPTTAVDLMTRADAELMAAQFSSEGAGERFVRAHLAALRAAAAVLAVRGRPTGRRSAGTVWELLAAVAPELEDWSVYFAAGAAGRRAVEAGRADAVDSARAEAVLCAAEDFLDAVRALLEEGPAASVAVSGRRQMLAVRAS